MENCNINVRKLNEYLSKTTVKTEPFLERIPYPQADDIVKVRLFVESAYSGHTTKEEQIVIHGFTGRQVDYYGNAAKYLGLIKITKQNFLPTVNGQLLATADEKMKNIFLIERMLEVPSIRGVFERLRLTDLTLDTVIASMREAGVNLTPETTEPRRAQTILAWVSWAIESQFC